MGTQASRIVVDVNGRHLGVGGVVDSHTAPQLQSALEVLGTGADVVLNLSGVEFIDSSGLRVVVNAHRDLADADRRLTIEAASDAVRRLFELTGLVEHLNLA